jgi:type IV pilus biogenesis protein CpaD/CtpE
MRDLILRSAALVAAACLLGACNEYGPEAGLTTPPDYSPRYNHVTAVNEHGRTKRVLAPDACLLPDGQSPAESGDARVPPGCANNYNLQRMAERKRDLTQGRTLSAAPAAPATRAAQRYIDGRDTPTLGGAYRDDKEVSGPAASTTVSNQ